MEFVFAIKNSKIFFTFFTHFLKVQNIKKVFLLFSSASIYNLKISKKILFVRFLYVYMEENSKRYFLYSFCIFFIMKIPKINSFVVVGFIFILSFKLKTPKKNYWHFSSSCFALCFSC